MSSHSIKIIITVVAATLIVVRIFWPTLLPADAVTLGLLIAMILPWVASLIETLEFPGGWKVQFRRLQEEVDSLKFLISNFLTAYELNHLRKFNDHRLDSQISFPYEKNDRFITELRHLRDLGLIRTTSPTGIGNIPEKGDLTQFLEITEQGQTYLRLRQ